LIDSGIVIFKGADGMLKNNRLYHVNNLCGSTAIPGELTDQGVFDSDSADISTNNNYSYDETGNLIKDNSAEIADIQWTLSGKVKKITRTTGSLKNNITFDYNAMSNRVAKHLYTSADVWISSNYYTYDASGNIMAIYHKTNDNQSLSLK
jgi:hypothetical protein